ncbi:MAG: EAL domain-containing protein [Epsilonproteobacteria bacterium]|nr:EAL domain-containing protein [Campylobacterota bacterium]
MKNIATVKYTLLTKKMVPFLELCLEARMVKLEEMIDFLKTKKLLYVEDNPEARESTLGVLEEFFTDITIAEDGVEGLEKFKNNEIDLIITDINMPKMSGLEMIQEIREFDEDVFILVLSAYNESGFFMDSIRLGVDGYLLKPIEIEQFISILQKITQKLKLKYESKHNLNLLNQYQEAADASSIVSKTDTKGIITYVNDKFCKISGYTKEELIGKNHNIVRHPDMPKEAFRDMWDTIKNKKQIWQGIVKNRKKDGNFYYVDATIKPILDLNGEILEYIALRVDITDIMDQKKQLNDLCANSKNMLVAYIKIDDFYDIERFYGQNIAIKFEEVFRQTLLEYMPEDCIFDNVFSLGNGEFALTRDKENCFETIDNVIKNIKNFQKKINHNKIKIEGVDYDISIILSLSCGEHALEDAKYGIIKLQTDDNSSFIFAKDLSKIEQKKAEKNLKIIRMIKKSIDNSTIVSYYQPIINNQTKEIEKYESLVRFLDEEFKGYPPNIILDIAKRGRYYNKITSKILENSFEAIDVLRKDVTINLSVIDIEKKLTRDIIYDFLQNNEDKAKKITFEMLEDEDVKDFTIVKEFIKHVKSFGVKIAIDDFGTGYSNFERLLDYDPDIIKIDGSLIKNLEYNRVSFSIVKSIITFVKEQNIKIVAEYVENENIYKILNTLGVDYSQGYYFGKPQPLEYYKTKLADG